MNPNQIFEDFDRKYQGSFVQVEFKDKPAELFQLQRINHGNTKFPQLILVSDTVGNVVLNYNTQARIFFKVPQTTYVQSGKDALLFTRRAERQWKRGVHANNCMFTNPLAHFYPLDQVGTFDFTTIREAFNPKYRTLYEALTLIQKENYNSVALSRNIALINGKKTKLVLFYRFAPIGSVTADGVIDSPNFEREIANEIK